MKNKLPVQIMVLPLLIFFIICVSNITVLAQGDNPLVDHVPPELIENINYSDDGEDVITDASGYDNFNLGVDFAEPHVTQNPNNPEQYFGAYNINGAWRTNDGHDWLHSSPNFGTNPNGDPCTAYDGSGNLYYETMYGGIQGCKVMRSTDNGTTWGASVTSILGGDKNWLAADQTTGPYSDYVYTTMTRSSFNGHGFARSTNNGTSWTTTFNASNSPLPGAMVCVGPNGATDGGSVYFVTNNQPTFSSTYSFYVSTDGGATFTFKSTQNFAGYVGTSVSGRHTVQFFRTRPYPFIAADQSGGAFRGRLYLVYASNTPAGNGNKPDIFCRYSTNQGSTWSSPVVINDDPGTTANHQWHPSIWCDMSSGRLYAKWMDTRDTPTSDSAYIYASYSDDGGITWAPNQQISNQKMRICASGVCNPGSANYMGDYDAIISTNNQALMMWTDFRSNNHGSYVGYFPDFAMQVSPTTASINWNGGETFITVDVPSVKLYSSTAIFSATVLPSPPNGTITFDFPSGNTISSYPGNVQLRITTAGNVTAGNYTVTIQGEGPNGTPVHRRDVSLDVIIPVELTSFTANTNGNNVKLNWTTATEINNQGFEVQRKMQNEEFASVGFVEGYGTTTETQNYSFTDENLLPGVHSYRLKQVDFDGTSELSDVVEVEVSTPLYYSLSQNYPNPFNPSTTISYSIPADGYVTLRVYDVLGNEVASLVDEQKQSGIFNIHFNASALSSGVYYYTLKASEFTSTKKLVLMK